MSKENNSTNDLDVVTIRFAGDSGDGMQLTGTQFTTNTAIFGNDLATLPDYPAEIRAPAGSLAGVSSFQLQFGNRNIYTPGDDLDVLVAMNPAALKVHLKDLKENGLLPPVSKSYLDVGSSYGWFVSKMDQAGFESYGLEQDCIAISVGIKIYGLKQRQIINSNLELFLKGTSDTFDVVSFLSVLHHFARSQDLINPEEIIKMKSAQYLSPWNQ